MNSYGDPSSARDRVQYPGGAGDPGSGADDPYRQPGPTASAGSGSGGWSAGPAGGQPGGAGRAQVPPTGGSGRASVGSASVGSASVGGSPARGAAPTGRARASVPGSAGAGGTGPGAGTTGGPAGTGAGGYGERGTSGRAAVGAASVGAASVGGAPAGRAAVARASVRPVSPGGASGGGGPGGPTGPGGARGGRRGRNDPEALARAKRRKRINLVIASFAVFIMLAGGGVVGVSYYAATVPPPEDIKLPEASTIYSRDGKPLAKLGDQNRILVTIKQIPRYVQYAVAAAEDRNFYEHSGVDYAGIARAAYNNFTGGSKQGASTITQQYARNAYENLKDDTYGRKVREAVMASKLNDKYPKDIIMQHYLNTIYFGRGAYGIEAAAQSYFDKPAEKLTLAEGAVLAGVIKQPNGTDGFDPALNLAGAKDRWGYVLDGMEKEGWLQETQQQRPTEFPIPKPMPKDGSCIADCGADTPQGNIINYVVAELTEKKLCKPGECRAMLREGGYRITTTIDNKMQVAAVNAASKVKKGSELYGKPKNLMAALVAIDPKTGGVLAYYGGENGTGTDYAGINTDPTTGALSGGHPPGSSFKIYTLAAALNNNIALKSEWLTDEFKPDGVPYTVKNAGRSDASISCRNRCTLEESTIKSLNVPYYYITDKIGPDKVLHMATQAGVTIMWDNKGKAHNLTTSKPEALAPKVFDKVIGYGQYGITVLDHANGLATLANRGLYNKAHFLKKVEQKDKDTGKWKQLARGGEQLKPRQTIPELVVDDVTATLAKIPAKNGDDLSGNRPAAGKTGTWELNGTKDNAHAWMVGYTPQVATAVWIGNEGVEKPIRENGDAISGGTLPAEVWKRFMNEAHKGRDVDRFKEGKGIGDDQAGNGEKPAPPPVMTPCPEDPTGINCPPKNGGGNNPGGPGDPTRSPGGGGGGGLAPTTEPILRPRD